MVSISNGHSTCRNNEVQWCEVTHSLSDNKKLRFLECLHYDWPVEMEAIGKMSHVQLDLLPHTDL